MTDTQASITLNAYDRTQAAFRSAMSSMEKFRKSAFNLKTALAGALSGVAIGAGIKSILDYADKTAKLADTIKITTKELQQYRFAGEQSRLTNEELDKGLLKLSKSLGELRLGQGSLNTFLKTADPAFLNTLKNTNDFSTALNLVLQRIGALKSPTEQAALANAAFGKSFSGFIRLTVDGGKELEKLKKQALDLGIVLSDSFLRSAEQTGDKLNIVMKILRATWAHVVEGMIPGLSKMADNFAKNSAAVISFGKAVGEIINTLSEFIVKLGEFAQKSADFADRVAIEMFARAGNAKLSNKTIEISIKKLNQLFEEQREHLEKASNAWTSWGKSLHLSRVARATEDIARLTKQVQIFHIALSQSEILSAGKAGITKTGEKSNNYKGSLDRKDEEKAKKDQLVKRINDLEMTLLSEEEKQYVHLSKMKEMADEALEKKVISKERYNQIIIDMEERTAEKVADINLKAAQKQYRLQKSAEDAYKNLKKETLNTAVQFLQTLGQKSKSAAIAAIALNKAIAIAQAIQNTAAAATKTLMAYGGTPAGYAAAAGVKVWGAAQIALIAATGLAEINGLNKKDGGGSGFGSSSPGASISSQQEQPRQSSAGRRVDINLGDDRDLISKSSVRKLIELINKEIKDGATIITAR